MNREEKAAAIEEIAGELGEAGAIFAIDYRGISVPQAAELRTKLREADAVFSVVKNRLAKRAAADAGTEGLDDWLVGPTALTLIKGDPVTAAKVISDFTREHDVLAYKGGFMDGAPLDGDGFQAIARLPGLDVLHGQLVGTIASPLTGLLAGMSNMISGLGRQLAQMAEQGLVSGEPPAEDATDTGSDPEPAETPEAASDEGSDPSAADETESDQDGSADEAPAEDAEADGESSGESDKEDSDG